MEAKLDSTLHGEAHSHKYFLTHGEPKVTEVKDILNDVTVDLSKYTPEQLYHMFKHTHEQDSHVIEEQNRELERLKQSVDYYKNMLIRSKDAKVSEKLRQRNEELERAIKWIKSVVKEFLHDIPV